MTAKVENLDKQIKDAEKKAFHWTKEIEQLCKVEKQEEIDFDFSDDNEEEEDKERDTNMTDETKESDGEAHKVIDKGSDELTSNNSVVEESKEDHPRKVKWGFTRQTTAQTV